MKLRELDFGRDLSLRRVTPYLTQLEESCGGLECICSLSGLVSRAVVRNFWTGVVPRNLVGVHGRLRTVEDLHRKLFHVRIRRNIIRYRVIIRVLAFKLVRSQLLGPESHRR